MSRVAGPDAEGGLDWPGLMRAGMRQLRLTPDQFWRLTPAELALMLGVGTGAQPMSRARLDALSRDWPDQSSIAEGEHGGD